MSKNKNEDIKPQFMLRNAYLIDFTSNVCHFLRWVMHPVNMFKQMRKTDIWLRLWNVRGCWMIMNMIWNRVLNRVFHLIELLGPLSLYLISVSKLHLVTRQLLWLKVCELEPNIYFIRFKHVWFNWSKTAKHVLMLLTGFLNPLLWFFSFLLLVFMPPCVCSLSVSVCECMCIDFVVLIR